MYEYYERLYKQANPELICSWRAKSFLEAKKGGKVPTTRVRERGPKKDVASKIYVIS